MPPARTPRSPKKRKRTPGLKLADALILRADCQKRIEQLKRRLLLSVKVQEGDRLPEDPASLLGELTTVADDLRSLVQRINRTNSSTELDPGLTIADAIAARDNLKLMHSAYRDIAAAAVVTQDRRTKSEVRIRSTVNVRTMQRNADDFAKQHRELDAKIQAANWQHDLHD